MVRRLFGLAAILILGSVQKISGQSWAPEAGFRFARVRKSIGCGECGYAPTGYALGGSVRLLRPIGSRLEAGFSGQFAKGDGWHVADAMAILGIGRPGQGPWIRVGLGPGLVPAEGDVTVDIARQSGPLQAQVVSDPIFDDSGYQTVLAGLVGLGYTTQLPSGVRIGPELTLVKTGPSRRGYFQLTAGLFVRF